MFTFPRPAGVLIVRFVILIPAIVHAVFVVSVPEITMFPPIRPGPVKVVYRVVIDGLSVYVPG